jgi:hypothetical protein
VFDVLEELLAAHDPTYLLAFGRDHYELISSTSESIKEPYIFDWSFDLAVDVKVISVDDDDKRALSVISGIIKTGGIETELSAADVLAELKRLGFPYLNHFAVSIFLDNSDKFAFAKLQNSTNFVLRAMENLYFDVYGRSRDPSFNLIWSRRCAPTAET